MMRASDHEETLLGPGLMQALGVTVALGLAALFGAWAFRAQQGVGADSSSWAWIGLGVLVLAAGAWLFWAASIYRRRWVLSKIQTHRLVEVLDLCYWQTDENDRLTLWRAPRDAPQWQWEAADLVGRSLWDAWQVESGQGDVASAARMRAGVTLLDIRVHRADRSNSVGWVLRGVPRYDLFGRYAGYEGTLRPVAETPSATRADASDAQPSSYAWSPIAAALQSINTPALLIQLPQSGAGDDCGNVRVIGMNHEAQALMGHAVAPASDLRVPPADPGELWRAMSGWPHQALSDAWIDALDELRLRLRARDAHAGTCIEVARRVAALSLKLVAVAGQTHGRAEPDWAVLCVEAGSAQARDSVLEDQESLMYAVSHDLRAPLRVVEGFTRIVKEDYGRVLDRIGNDHLDRVLGASGRMSSMIDALLDQAKLSTRCLNREPVNLSQMAALVVEDLRRQTPQRQVEVVIEDGLMADGDPLLLRMVLENLLGNAWKYSAKRPRARIEFLRVAQPSGLTWAYCVRDNGVGFDMRYADRLFGMFQRLHSANDYQGTGVGLASVRRIVHRHGGRIWAESEVDVGTRFHFTLGDTAAGHSTPS